MKIKYLLATLWLAASGCALADAPFTVSVDGQEVTDGKTGLIWRRCAEGMGAPGGACTGLASAINHEEALALARDEATSTGVAWRLPNVRELASIADKSRSNPAIDAVAFPATPGFRFWSSSPVPDGSARLVNFSNGGVDYNVRPSRALVRLVRAGQ